MKPSRISTKLRIVGGLLSLMIFLIIGLVVAMNEKSKKDSLIINIAGKQRMLTQKMSKEIFFLRHRDSHDFRQLDGAMELFENNLNDLRFGNSDRGIYAPQNSVIENKLEEVAKGWGPFKEELESVKKGILSVKSDKEVLSKRIELLLNMSDKIVQEMVAKNLEGVYIDLSGRQRMLSQRMGLFIERYLRTDNREDYFLFVNAKALYDETLTMFAQDATIQGHPDVHGAVVHLQQYWGEFETYVTHLLEVERAINASIAYVNRNNVRILDNMDEAVWLYTEHSENKNQLLVNSLFFIGIMAMVVILYTFVLVRDMVSNIDRFVDRAKRLANIEGATPETVSVPEGMETELQEASSYLQAYVGKVSVAMRSSEEAIKRAENSIGELQALAENVEEALRDLVIDEETRKKLGHSMNATEDIAIESTESLMNVSNMLNKLKDNLASLAHNAKQTR
ncbi:type IV pili methyl-accepting chemotaxis transducer N-terminal domain-containing protein [Sulfurospirillum sp. T05]|uniref:Type IV pili methyl-accepting chemotaxis transducer N-terminal domain-containing protein n=1 Tax=Sulfurospirillum tamanense TaxID=2813362 RepID=A0ABS2WSS2_9BACT|nr:type IV pili methyl-accepting chemotaxis transducer N-terminal domain-containing protein [Sulfurospirillum tamanensis]MBN2964713.1 type IV pili methyl-accepting chemotaxis transducer N-terminal domain-containing protein [Sulfurospirillum tamanensis]